MQRFARPGPRSAAAVALGIVLATTMALPAVAVPISWTAPTTLSGTADATGVQLATAPDGSITAVWAEWGSGFQAIMSATSLDGGTTWSATTQISVVTTDQYLPQIAIDGAGVRTVVWGGWGGATSSVETASSTDGLTWNFHQVLSPAGARAERPRIAIDPTGLRYVLWDSAPAGVAIVQSTTSVDGILWTPTVDVSTVGLDSRGVDIVVRGAGNVVAIWTFASGPGGVQSSATADGGLSWTMPVDLVPRFPVADDARIIVSSTGTVAASWNRDDGFGNTIVQVATSPDGQNWNAPVDISLAGVSSSLARIAFAPDGTLHATWSQIAADSIVYAAHSVDGGVSWSPPVTISAAGDYSLWPTFAIDSASNVTIIWMRDDFSSTSPKVESKTSTDGGVTFPLAVTITTPPTSGYHESPSPEAVVSSTDVITAIWVVFTGPFGVVQVANSVSTVPAPAAGSGLGLAPTGSALSMPLALLGSGLIIAGVLIVHPRRQSAHRASR